MMKTAEVTKSTATTVTAKPAAVGRISRAVHEIP